MARRSDTVETRDRDRHVDVTDRPAEHRGGTVAMTDGNGSAIAALVIGMFAATFAFTGVAAIAGILFGIVAIGFGIAGVSKANSLGGMHKGLAISGIVAGVLGLLLSLAIAAGAIAAFNDPQIQQQIQNALNEAGINP